MRQLRAVGAHRITLTQLSAMASIHRAGELTLGELASRERVQPPSMTRVITTLHDNGLVARKPDPSDGRQVLVSLTEDGVRILEEEAATREAWLADQIKTLSDDERDTLIRASEILMRLIGE
jgi:DNA-binding MarR family transcriptional regulator